jgi:pimeloyl-ACP methyl ester carboxylesterase
MKETLVFRRLALLLILLVVPIPAFALAPTASFESGSVQINQYGSGSPALVLIPGLTDSGAVWDTTVAHYANAHTIFVLTLPGFGGRPPAAAPMLDTVDKDVAAFLPRANKPVIIGHSMGGILAIRLAEEHSDLIRGAIAIDGLPVFAGMEKMTPEARATAAAAAGDRIASATPAQFAKGQQAQLGYLTKPPNVATAASFSQGADIKATGTYMTELMSSDLRPNLSHITVPFLEIGPFDATLDPMNPYSPQTTLAQKQAYYQSLFVGDPTAQVVMIDDSRHFVMLDQPAKLFAAIDAFLAALK